MRLLKTLVLISLVALTACLPESGYTHAVYEDVIEFDSTLTHSFPNAVRVLGEGSDKVSLPSTDLLDIDYILDTLELTNHFPGVHLVSRSFVEQMVNTLLSLGHIKTIENITDIFMYLHMEYGNYSYLVWWSNNQLMLAGDFVIIRESFLR